MKLNVNVQEMLKIFDGELELKLRFLKESSNEFALRK
jgi:hypothetical protein